MSASPHRLPATLSMGAVTLRSPNVDRLVPFYERVLGLRVADQTASAIHLGAGAGPLVELLNDPQAKHAHPRAPGLFHLALRVPNRAALAERIAALQVTGLRFGASDHLVSEALYVDDPDGNGIEIYCDRPHEVWPRTPDGRIAMATLPLDVPSLRDLAPMQIGSAPHGTDMGHVHLKVRDLAEAERFWVDLLGFDLVTTYPGALFVSAGGYHHHVGLNIWSSRGGPLPPDRRLGLDHLTVRIPQPDIDALGARVSAAGHSVHGDQGPLLITDPSGNRVRFVSD